MIVYKPFSTEYMQEAAGIYQRAGWTAYLKDEERLKKAFERSLYVLGAFEKDKLIGFIRCVGDGEHIVYIQDLIVDLSWKRQGIGRNLMKKTMEHFQHVRMLTLMTDAQDEAANAFYRSIGLQACDQNGLKTYFW